MSIPFWAAVEVLIATTSGTASPSVRARDDENCDYAFENTDVEPRGDDPRDGRNRRDAECHVEQPASCAVCEQLGSRFRFLGFINEPHDARQRRLLARLRDFDAETSVLVDRPGDDLHSGRFVNGTGLARDHRLVDGRLAFDDFAVGRHARARTDEYDIVFAEFGNGYFLGIPALGDTLGGVRHEFRQFVERAGGLSDRPHLHPVAQEHDVDQRNEFPEERRRPLEEQTADGVDERDGDRQRDEHHHPRLAVLEFRPGHRENGTPPYAKMITERTGVIQTLPGNVGAV